MLYREGDQNLYLLLHYSSQGQNKDYFDFPKGHIEEGETEEETARREIEEETGIEKLFFFPDFKEWIKYFFKKEGETVFKMVVFFLARCNSKEVTISEEHKGYRWATYKQAMKLLEFQNSREVLKKAHLFCAQEVLF